MEQRIVGKAVFLTSSPDASYQVDGIWVTGPFTERNGFLERFRNLCPVRPRVLLITADPDEREKNQEMREYFAKVFSASSIPVQSIRLLEQCTKEHLEEWLDASDLVILGGGHVPTQNRFFHEIGLKERMAGFNGVVMGISAGSMNCAKVVYAQPELEGEAADPNYCRYLEGLGLTERRILPHYQNVKDFVLDGLRLMEQITYPDSMGKEFYALEDGSYILNLDGQETLYGNAWLIADGEKTKICGDGESRSLS